MRRPKRTTVGLIIGVVLTMLAALVLLKGPLREAHADETIQYFSSDAAQYFVLYEDLYSDVELSENPVLFLIGSPVLFMKLADGDLFVIQFCNLLLMGFALKVAFGCLPTARARKQFILAALVFPYFLFGFLSLNKEVYAMCSSIFFGCYMVRGRYRDLVFALLLAACARYYMFISLLVLLVMLPRERPPRYKLVLAMLLFISIAAPIAKSLVPQYSSEGLRDVSGASGLFFAQAVDSFAYGIIYPIKYVALIPLRAYSFLLATGREGDGMEAVVSLASLWAFVAAIRLLPKRRRASPIVRQLVVAGLIAPIPMMWSDIMHWRYYSYVYFFFVFAIVIHSSEQAGARAIRRQLAAQAHA